MRIFRSCLMALPAAKRHRDSEFLVQLFSDRIADLATPRARLATLFGECIAVLGAGCRIRLDRRWRPCDETRLPTTDPEGLVGNLFVDLRYAIRALRMRPGFVLLATLTLALGIGANTAIFSVVYGVLLRPLALTDPDRVVFLVQTRAEQPGAPGTTSPQNLEYWREHAESFQGITAWYFDSLTLEEPDAEAQELGYALKVGVNFFDVLGVRPALGRGFNRQDEVRGAPARAAVVSHQLWRDRWGSDPQVIGRSVGLDGAPHEIVGVMPPQVPIPGYDIEVWIPVWFDVEDVAMTRRLNTVGRLRDGTTIELAQREMSALSEAIGEAIPAYAGWDVAVMPAHDRIVGAIGPALLITFGAVTFVLLITCANLANLLLARATVRRREYAIRAAVGASRGRIARQAMLESLAIALLGGAVGIGVARIGHSLLLAAAPAVLPRVADIRLDLPVLGFGFAVALATGVLFGVLPAWQSASIDPSRALRGTGATSTAGGHARAGLVVSQVAITMTLITGAGMLLLSLFRLASVDPGYDAGQALAARIFLNPGRYADEDVQRRYFDDLLAELRTMTGVEAVGGATGLPMDPVGIDFDSPFMPENFEGERADLPRADYRFATPGYTEALGIPLLAGRTLRAADGVEDRPVTVVNETLARNVWPGESPLGKRVTIFFRGAIEHEIVGVVGDVRFRGLRSEPRPELYVPFRELPWGTLTVVVRTPDPAAAAARVRATVLARDPRQPPHSVLPVADLVTASLAGNRFYATLLTAFAAVAMAISGAGIYGVISYWVSRSTHEIGVRVALGAARSGVVGLVTLRGARLTLIGTAIGTVGSLLAGRLLEGLLFGVSTTHAGVLTAAAGGLALVAMAACYVPARRAARVSPVAALRQG